MHELDLPTKIRLWAFYIQMCLLLNKNLAEQKIPFSSILQPARPPSLSTNSICSFDVFASKPLAHEEPLLVNKWQDFLLDPNKSWLPWKTTRMTDFAENQPVAWKSLWLFDIAPPNPSSLLKNYIKRGRRRVT